MSARSQLGPADVDDATLAAMVADLLGHASVELLDVEVSPVAYDVPSITTVGRHWVSGTARTPAGTEPWRMFVKHVQAWHHSPFFAFVPDEAKEMAAAGVPWRSEPLAYRSDLGDRLPEGLSMPRALGVFDLEPDAAAIWLPEITHAPAPWTPERFERAAYLLGRLAGSARVAERADVGAFEWNVFHYVHGRLLHQVRPMVLGDEAWQAPGVRAAFDDDLRDRMRAAVTRLEEYAGELVSLPTGTSHGDASPGNLLPGAGPDDFVLIDYAFWMRQPIGFDLGQLMAGDIQLGRASAAGLAGPDGLDATCVTAYTRGLGDEGVELDVELVRRAHALQLLLFAGVSSLPEGEMPPEVLAERAALARFSLDLVDATG